MATHTANYAQHATLSSTTADQVTIGTTTGPRMGAIEVVNRDTAQALYFTWTPQGTTAPTTAVAAADETYYVGPSSALAVPIGFTSTSRFIVSVVGNGNAYSVHGIPA